MVDLKLVNKGKEGEILMQGGLDAACAGQVEKVVMDVADKFDNITLNMSGLDYMSSAGLRFLRALQVKMTQKGGRLYVKNPKPAVMEVFEMTGFASFLDFTH